MLARHLFVERGHHRLVIDPRADNRRAIRAYERVGFRRVGVMRSYERGADGAWHDGLLMDMLRGELVRRAGSGRSLDSRRDESGRCPASAWSDRDELLPRPHRGRVGSSRRRPRRRRTELRLELARRGARCVGILITHGHWDHLGAVADLAEGTGAPVHMAEAERELLEQINESRPAGLHLRPHTPDVLLAGDEIIELAGITFETLRVPGHSPAHLAYAADGALFSGRRSLRRLGRTNGLPRLRLGDAARLDHGSRRAVPARDDRLSRATARQTTLGAELATNPFLAELRAALR